MARIIPTLILSANYTQRSSDIQPLWHFALLSITTFGLYHIYWFYRNLRYLKVYNGLDISPVKRTIGILIPILSFFIVYNLIFELRDFVRDGGVDRLYAPGWIFSGYWISLCLYTSLPDPYWILGFLSSVVALAIVQRTLNSYWEVKQPCLPKKTNYHFLGELIVATVLADLSFLLIESIL